MAVADTLARLTSATFHGTTLHCTHCTTDPDWARHAALRLADKPAAALVRLSAAERGAHTDSTGLTGPAARPGAAHNTAIRARYRLAPPLSGPAPASACPPPRRPGTPCPRTPRPASSPCRGRVHAFKPFPHLVAGSLLQRLQPLQPLGTVQPLQQSSRSSGSSPTCASNNGISMFDLCGKADLLCCRL